MGYECLIHEGPYSMLCGEFPEQRQHQPDCSLLTYIEQVDNFVYRVAVVIEGDVAAYALE